MERAEEPIDLLVVGGGTAGIVGAKTAAQLGARTVLVERSRTGGDCLWTGCIPSKTLLSAAAQTAGGRDPSGGNPDFTIVRERIAAAIASIEPADSPAALEAAGVSVISGTVRFTAPGEAFVNNTRILFRQALIATGSAPTIPPIPGLENAQFVTSETIWDLTELPSRLAIIGGGPIACELGQAFARLGSQVVILARSGILPKEIRDAAVLVRQALKDDGVSVVEHNGADTVVSRQDGTSTIHTADGGTFDADVILTATGRSARTDELGLENVGVTCDESGQVVVDSGMRTSNPAFWAAGDVTGHPKFTHLAGVHASTAASNAVLGLRRAVSGTIPRVTYTSPEVASVGVTDASVPGRTTSTVQLEDTDRAITESSTTGFAQLVIDRRGRILGGTIVGPRAGESLAELTLAVHKKMTTRELAGVTHPYPTYNDALWNAAIAHARSGLGSAVVVLAVKALSRLARWRSDRRP
ncbi:FAD-dependent oxidoreductase [Arthrobacter sp. H5]|uniref:dihydrolipoyl dehydrogenase family protein n=1 Tax=Arthrobacter sp. H5 TaxID=1267973 RepID=UPI0004885270|nr:FAD-dependent oxidoreductase [Arthrobacter sp. H5]